MFVRIRPVLLIAVSIVFGSCGCGYFQSNQTEEQKRENEQKTRDEVAKATERAKPELEKAGRELKEAAKTAADEAHAAAQGVKDGWENGSAQKVDLNSASEDELASLPGITHRQARKIVAERPFHSPHELVEKGIASEARYAEIRNQITVH